MSSVIDSVLWLIRVVVLLLREAWLRPGVFLLIRSVAGMVMWVMMMMVMMHVVMMAVMRVVDRAGLVWSDRGEGRGGEVWVVLHHLGPAVGFEGLDVGLLD